MIRVNGINKHGTHAALKAIELLGFTAQWREIGDAVLGHWKYPQPWSEGDHHVFIVRNPKDAIISLMRSHGDPLQDGLIRSRILSFPMYYDNGYAEYCRPFLGWLEDQNTHIVRLEKLRTDQAEIDSLAEYLGVTSNGDELQYLPGHTVSWNREYTDHKKYWSDKIQLVWEEAGGLELERALGYAG